MNCVCDGQCGRHNGPCPERNSYTSRLNDQRGRRLAWLEKRSDGRVWCGICWTAEQKRRAAERRAAKARHEAEIAAAEERQEKLF